MSTEGPSPQINVSKIPVGGGVAGAVVAAGSMLIFLLGIPALRFFLPAAILCGCVIALIIRVVRVAFPGETPGAPWIIRDEPRSRPDGGAAPPGKWTECSLSA
jgi:hypothetical protein